MYGMKQNEYFKSYGKIMGVFIAVAFGSSLTIASESSTEAPTLASGTTAKRIECEASNQVRTQKQTRDLGVFFLRAEIVNHQSGSKTRTELTSLQTAYQDHAAIKAGTSKEWTPQMKAISLGPKPGPASNLTRSEPSLSKFRAHIFGPAGKLTTFLIPSDAIQQSEFVAVNNIEAGDEAHGGPFTIHQKFRCRVHAEN